MRVQVLPGVPEQPPIDPEVALVVAKGLPAFAGLQISDEGKVTGVDELVKSLVETTSQEDDLFAGIPGRNPV